MEIKYRNKQESKFQRFIGWLHPSYMQMYTTIGSTVWCPDDDMVPPSVAEHEAIHVAQWKKWGPLFLVLYLFFPVPVFFAYFRWRFEREAYLVNIQKHGYNIDWAVTCLWRNYFFTWPKSWMERWFINKVFPLTKN